MVFTGLPFVVPSLASSPSDEATKIPHPSSTMPFAAVIGSHRSIALLDDIAVLAPLPPAPPPPCAVVELIEAPPLPLAPLKNSTHAPRSAQSLLAPHALSTLEIAAALNPIVATSA